MVMRAWSSQCPANDILQKKIIIIKKQHTSVFLLLTLGGTSSLSDLAQAFWVGSGTSDLESEL